MFIRVKVRYYHRKDGTFKQKDRLTTQLSFDYRHI